MKKLVVISTLLIMLASCAKRDIYLMSDEEMKKSPYSMAELCVMKGDTNVVAKVVSVEWELYNGELIQEVSLSLESYILTNEIKDIVSYIHTRFKDYKIEINMDNLEPFKNN